MIKSLLSLKLLIMCLLAVKFQIFAQINPKETCRLMDSLLSQTAFHDSLYNVHTAETFFQLDIVKQQIDLTNIDNGLLNAAVFYATNEVRVKKRRKEFLFHPVIRDAAFSHSIQMAYNKFYSHINGKVKAFRKVNDRVKFFADRTDGFSGFRSLLGAENIAITPFQNIRNNEKFQYIKSGDEHIPYKVNAMGKPLEPLEMHTYESFAKALVSAWMNSKGHRQNILNSRYVYLGTGVMPDPLTIRDKTMPMAKSAQCFSALTYNTARPI